MGVVMGQKQKYYCQCRLKKVLKLGEISHEVSWIPEKFAQKGRLLKIKRNGVWDNGWEVINVWDKKSRDEVMEMSRNYLHQREASDI